MTDNIQHNKGDTIADGLAGAAEVTEIANQEGIAKTGNMAIWLRLSSAIARTGARIFGKK